MASGEIELDGKPLRAGDGAAIEAQERVALAGRGEDIAEVLLFDLP